MSRTYDIACTLCKKALWVGQASAGSRHIYTRDTEVMRKLNDFLWQHQNHPLVFCNDQALDDDYEEIS